MSNGKTQTLAPAKESPSPVMELNPPTPRKTGGRAPASPQQASSNGAPHPSQITDVLTSPARTGGAASRARQMNSMQHSVGNARLNRALAQNAPQQRASPFSAPGASSAAATIQRKCGCAETGAGAKEKCETCAGSEPKAQRKSEETTTVVSRALNSSGGQPVAATARAPIEQATATDLQDVRVHTDAPAARAARDLNAEAFTVGSDIYFGSGRYQPETKQGQKLLAHELAHTAQQQGVVATSSQLSGLSVSQPGDALEKEADEIAERAMSGTPDAAGVSVATGTIQRSWLDDLGDIAQDVADTVSDVGQSIVETGEAAVGVAGEAVDWALTTAGQAALSAADALASMFGGHVTVIGTTIIITIDDISLCDESQETIAETDQEGFFIPLIGGGAPVGPIVVAGALGIAGWAQIQFLLATGPCELRNIAVVIDPLANTYVGTAELYIAAAAGPRITLFGGLAGVGAVIIPTDPPIPIVASIEGGLRGTGTGWAVGAIQSTVTLGYAGGTLFFDMVNNFMAGVLVTGDIDLYAAARLYGIVICDYVYPLGHWETGAAYQLTVPITAGLGSGGGSVGIGPITHGPIPISDIETAIEPLDTGFHCKSIEEIIEELCEIEILPPELCEEDDEGTSGPPRPGVLGKKWGCKDVRCNVYPVEEGAKCPDRVIGNTPCEHSSFDDACKAAQKDANSKVPPGCNKRHCNCKTKCKQC